MDSSFYFRDRYIPSYEKIAEEMFTMAKMYMFPEKKKLPANVEKRLKEIAKEYMEMVYAIAVLMGVEDTEQPEYMEVMELIAEAFGEGVADAIDEMEKDSSN